MKFQSENSAMRFGWPGSDRYVTISRRGTDCTQDFQVDVELPRGVQAAYHVNLRGAVGMRRCGALRDLIDGKLVRLRVAPPFTERAKGAF